jgi:cholest-4-en-3-one 26-monooxygenase
MLAALRATGAELTLDDIDLNDGANFVASVPHEWFRFLRREAPVFRHPDPQGQAGTYWCVTRYEDCVTVNRDAEHFSSAQAGALFNDMEPEQLEQQRLMMLNMDPPLHTRYRRLVNKGFTPRMVRDLESKIVAYADDIIDNVCETGRADFVEDMAAELPLLVIAEIMGVPPEDRHQVFEWSNRMIGREDPEYQVSTSDETLADGDPAWEESTRASMELFAYADELTARKRAHPSEDMLSVLTRAEMDGESLNQLELDLFFLLLAVAGNETTRNLMSGAMTAFFEHPEQWRLLLEDRSLLGKAVEEMLRFVTPVMHFRRQATEDFTLTGQQIEAGDKVVFWHISANRDESAFTEPDRLDITRDPNPHIAFGGGGPHFCLGANLARMEIGVMFSRILDRLPDIHLDGEVQRLHSNFINGTKHLPVAFSPAPAGAH